MEKDFTIFKISWFTRPESSVTSAEAVYARHRALINFLQDNNLTTRTILEPDAHLNDDSSLLRSDLTDKGFLLYQKAEQKWLRGIDKGQSPTDMHVFEKELSKL